MGPILAKYVAVRSIGSRGMISLVLDVHEDLAAGVVEYLGWPVPGVDVHVALVKVGAEEPADVVHGTYAEGRPVKVRKAFALNVEVPAERGTALTQKLGFPTTTAPIDVVLARLVGEPLPPVPTSTRSRSLSSMAIQRCVMLCKTPSFQRFLIRPHFQPGANDLNEKLTTEQIYLELDIPSRSRLNDPEKLAEWHAMVRRYEQWMQGGTLPGEA